MCMHACHVNICRPCQCIECELVNVLYAVDEAEELCSTIYVYYDGAVKQDVARPVILFAGNLDKKIACIKELQFGNCRETLP